VQDRGDLSRAELDVLEAEGGYFWMPVPAEFGPDHRPRVS